MASKSSTEQIPVYTRFIVRTTDDHATVKRKMEDVIAKCKIKTKLYAVADFEDKFVHTKEDAYLTFQYGKLTQQQIGKIIWELQAKFGQDVRVKTIYTKK